MKKFLILIIAAILILAGAALAQEAAPAAEIQPAEEAIEYSYGTVVSVSATQLVVSEYDYDTGAEANVTYAIDANVKLKNVALVSEIAPGDYVEVDYVMKDAVKVAKVIYVEKQPAEGTSTETPEQSEEEPEIMPME